MKPEYFCVDVLLERVPIVNRWADEQWRPAAVLPVARIAPDSAIAAPGDPERVADGPAGTTWRFPGCAIELHPTEAEGYYLNITSDTPLVFVMWRAAEDGLEPAARVQMVTVSYNQAGRIMDMARTAGNCRQSRSANGSRRRARATMPEHRAGV